MVYICGLKQNNMAKELILIKVEDYGETCNGCYFEKYDPSGRSCPKDENGARRCLIACKSKKDFYIFVEFDQSKDQNI